MNNIETFKELVSLIKYPTPTWAELYDMVKHDPARERLFRRAKWQVVAHEQYRDKTN